MISHLPPLRLLLLLAAVAASSTSLVSSSSSSFTSAQRSQEYYPQRKFAPPSPSSPLYPSASTTHIEPLLSYTLHHSDNQHIHEQHANNELSVRKKEKWMKNKVNSLGAHSIRKRVHSSTGLTQPFPSTLTIRFSAYGEIFHLPDMRLQTGLFHSESMSVVVDDETGEEKTIPNVLQSYTYSNRDRGIDATVTLNEDGLWHGLILRKERDSVTNETIVETYQIDPLYTHRQHLSTEVHSALQQVATHQMVVFKHSHLKEEGVMGASGKADEGIQCGVKIPPTPPRGNNNGNTGATTTQNTSSSDADIHLDSLHAPTSMMRRLMALPPGEGVKRWTNCYPGDTTPQKISIGVATDFSYFSIFGSVSSVQASIAATYSNVNLVYLAQFNIYLQIESVYIKAVSGGEKWNQIQSAGQVRCPVDISPNLDEFTSWRLNVKPTRDALWHLFTNCYPAPGVVGLAWQGVLCSTQYGTGISSYTQTHWLVVAHETGHNFGSGHAFQLGQGKTGGIMDYGDSTYPIGSGIYQFNDVYGQDPICGELTSALGTSGFTPFCSTEYKPTCGNGIIEVGEDCDDQTSCCTNECRFPAGAVCTAANGNACCNAASCQYEPSSISCGVQVGGVNQGYCYNGECHMSVCTDYSNLQYCGLSSQNPCRQSCLYQSTCTDAFPAIALNMPDGTVCSQAPFSTCSAGKCVGQDNQKAINYTWKSENPSLCTCDGIQTYRVTCQDSYGTVSPDDKCSGAGEQPNAQQTCTPPTSCSTWKEGGYSKCSVDCGSGVQTQVVTCVKASDPNVTLSPTQCSGTTKPATTRTCTAGACPVAWQASGYGACSKSCGSGVTTQTVSCVQTQNGITSAVAFSACAGQTKPATSKTCNAQSCLNGLQYTYGTFGPCSVQCGGGTQTRTAVCTQNGSPVTNTALCTPQNAGTPETSQTCNTAACPTRAWHAGDYGECNVACGGGTQSRVVQCYDTANDPQLQSPIPNDYCIDAKPESLRTCNTDSCGSAVELQWYTSPWSACSEDCQSGGGTSTRTVTCVNSAQQNSRVDMTDAACLSSTTASKPKPITKQQCNQNGCGSYAYLANDWSSCSVMCGGGVQTRKVECRDALSGAGVDSTFCSNQTSAASEQPCNTQACASGSYGWNIGTWSACSAACDGGYRIRKVTCVDGNGASTDTSNCATQGTMPQSQSTCATHSCGTYWSTGSWSTCSATCGVGGMQTRSVTCVKLSNPLITLADSSCSNTKPSTSASCNNVPCPTYVASETWSECSERCGQGTQTRGVACLAYDGRTLDLSACTGSVMPSLTRVCMNLQCPHWHRGDWSLCSAYCGGGTQNRSLVCRMPHDNITYGIRQPDTSLCPPVGEGDVGDGVGTAGVTVGQPPNFQTCAINACPSYYWKLAGSWSECTEMCGPNGVTRNTVVCTSVSTGLPAQSESLCLDDKPAEEQPCNTEMPCPIYQWRSLAWSECKAYCGPSIQVREIECFDINPDPGMHLPAIRVNNTFCYNAGLETPSTEQSCQKNPSEICYGIGSSGDASLRNGRCTSQGVCHCRSGYIGDSCTSKGSFLNVQTNADLFTQGIPLNEPLLVTWTSDTDTQADIPYVQVILMKSKSTTPISLSSNLTQQLGPLWNTGQYLGSNVANTGLFKWLVGTKLADLELGNGYRVRVYVSQNLYAESEEFRISDPCGYKSCGLHGTCSRGVCSCTSGWTGENCQLGPCEQAQCKTETSMCNNTVVTTALAMDTSATLSIAGTSSSTSICSCKSGYTGAQCRTPSVCASTVGQCLNGGDMDINSAVLTTTSCSSAVCSCPPYWTGTHCETCSLQCQNGGTPNSACSSCSCPVGFMGNQCRCKYYMLDMQFNMDWSAWSNDDISVTRFKRVLSVDIQLALLSAMVGVYQQQQPTVMVESVEFPEDGKVKASVRIALECPDVTAMVSGGGGSSGSSAVADDLARAIGRSHISVAWLERTRNLVLDASNDTSSSNSSSSTSTSSPLPIATLSSMYSSLLPYFSDTDSPLWNGQTTSHLDSSYSMKVSDPTGQDELQQPNEPQDCYVNDCTGDHSSSSSSSMNMTLIIIISVGVIAFLMLALTYAIFLWNKKRAKRAQRDANRTKMEMTNTNTAVDATQSNNQI